MQKKKKCESYFHEKDLQFLEHKKKPARKKWLKMTKENFLIDAKSFFSRSFERGLPPIKYVITCPNLIEQSWHLRHFY